MTSSPARHWGVRRTSLATALLAVAAVLVAVLTCADDEAARSLPDFRTDIPQNRASWWVKLLGEAPQDDPLVARADEVFERVRDAAGAGPETDLFVVGEAGQPAAMALADGNVVLTRDALELTYDDVDLDTGDARLAFVLGHELDHLSSRDWWHALAFEAVRQLDSENEAVRALREILEHDAQDAKGLELRADEAGAAIAVMAGYDSAFLDDGGRGFFEEWVGRPLGRLAYADPAHPKPSERALNLSHHLAGVASRVDLFHEGVALYRAARYEEALERFDRFLEVFRGREVLSNLGLAHYQLAVRLVNRCDSEPVLRYRLPTEIDRETLADRTRNRGAGERSSPCLEGSQYREHVEKAIGFFEEAAEQDPAYLPARLNLVSALVLDEQYARALVHGMEAAEAHPEDARAANAVAVAHAAYVGSLGGGGDALEERLRFFPQARQRFPNDPALAYNHAAILSRAGRLEEARPIWEELLELELAAEDRETAWTAVAREWLTGEAHEPPAWDPPA